MHKLKVYIEKNKKILFCENFSKSMKFHVKCVLNTEKTSFDKKFLSDTFNIYFIYSSLKHKSKIKKYQVNLNISPCLEEVEVHRGRVPRQRTPGSCGPIMRSGVISVLALRSRRMVGFQVPWE